VKWRTDHAYHVIECVIAWIYMFQTTHLPTIYLESNAHVSKLYHYENITHVQLLLFSTAYVGSHIWKDLSIS
jgi:hypothetical protein